MSADQVGSSESQAAASGSRASGLAATGQWDVETRKTQEEVRDFINLKPQLPPGHAIVTFRGRTDEFVIWWVEP